MDALKALVAKKKEAKKEVYGSRSYVKRGELEAVETKRRREEESAELEAKRRRSAVTATPAPLTVPAGNASGAGAESPATPNLPEEEVVRRLRALGQPKTLFGEDAGARFQRLRRAEREHSAEDKDILDGGKNTLWELEQEEKAEREAARIAAAAAAGSSKTNASKDDEGPADPEADLMAAFAAAAGKVKDIRAEENLPLRLRCSKQIKVWLEEWRTDIDQRTTDEKETPAGRRETMTFRESEKFLGPLFYRLRNDEVVEDFVLGLWMMIGHMRARNYLAANDVYLKLAIGNAPWPIGVTSVGIHERSAREKISHSMNANGAAHIMNDEASRKYLQAIKRLTTWMQRKYPSDPSRSMNFNSLEGSRSDKTALLEAQKKGDLPQMIEAPPNYIDTDGRIKVPPKWGNLLREARGKAKGSEKM